VNDPLPEEQRETISENSYEIVSTSVSSSQAKQRAIVDVAIRSNAAVCVVVHAATGRGSDFEALLNTNTMSEKCNSINKQHT